MNEKYLGEFPPEKDNPYADYKATDWALEYICRYGQIDGEHHKLWVLDQVTRILHGTPVIVKLAKWDTDKGELREYRFTTGIPSKAYLDWVEEGKNDGEYDYDEGIAP